MLRLPLFAAAVVAAALPAALVAQTPPDPRGAYRFETHSTRGDPFEGTVHLYGESDDELVTADVPVLLLSGRYDPATPVRWGRQVADALPTSLHVIMPGISHASFPECAQDIMTQFVAVGGIVGVNADCVGELQRAPFRTRRE
jgi:pimeloyl-ACP methyl ester carboxylesterase